jgi:hypothetical protein
MRSFAAASTIPVTNKVAHANSRKSLRIRVITSPMRTGPMHCRHAKASRRRDGDTSNLAQNARRLDWFPTPQTFAYVFALFPRRFRRCHKFQAFCPNLIFSSPNCLRRPISARGQGTRWPMTKKSGNGSKNYDPSNSEGNQESQTQK